MYRFESRRDFIADDLTARDVGQRAFQSVTRLDAHLVVLNKYEEHCAVVQLGLADLPGVEDALAVILQRRVGLQLFENGDDDLVGRVAFKLLQLVIELLGCAAWDHSRVIVEIMLRFGRECLRAGREKQRQPQPADEQGGAHLYFAGAGVAPKLKFTGGGTSEPSRAVK